MDLAAVRALRELYRQVPTINCKRLCGHACRTVIDMSHVERERIEKSTGVELPPWMRERPGLMCPLLDSGHECTVYGLRPMICRLWGVVDSTSLRCNHGCTVNGDMLSTMQAQALVMESFRIGGSDLDPDFIAVIQAVVAANEEELGPLMERVIDGDHSPALVDAVRAILHKATMPE